MKIPEEIFDRTRGGVPLEIIRENHRQEYVLEEFLLQSSKEVLKDSLQYLFRRFWNYLRILLNKIFHVFFQNFLQRF